MMYTFDLESSYDGEMAWCWSWGLLSESGEYKHGNGTNLIEALTSPQDNSVVWVHNLSFDGEFIINELIDNSYALIYGDMRNEYNAFSIEEDETGIRSINVKAGFKTIVFRDSLRIFRCSLAEIPKICGLSTNKLSMNDGYINRPRDHVSSADEAEYQYYDCKVLCDGMKWVRSNGCVGNTAGSIALNYFKKCHGKSPFKALTEAQRNLLRSLYVGGCCSVNPSHRRGSRIVLRDPASVYDCNSIYPDKVKNYELPVRLEGLYAGASTKPGLKAHLVQMKDIRLNWNRLPLLITPFTGAGRENIDLHEAWFFEDELEVIHSCYSVGSTNILQTAVFATENIDGGFVDHWYKTKTNAKNSSERSHAKLYLNNLTGKFGQSSVRDIYHRRVSGGISSLEHLVEHTAMNNWHFMPAVARITSLSRMQLERVTAGLTDWYYVDTDSVHTPDKLSETYVHQSALGLWKHETDFTTAMYIKPKSYWELGDDEEVLRHAGIRGDATLAHVEKMKVKRHIEEVYHDTGEKISSSNMRPGNVFFTKQMKRVKGGAAIVNICKRL